MGQKLGKPTPVKQKAPNALEQASQLYENGYFKEAGELYSQLLTKNESIDALWGKLGSEIMTSNWNQALEDINKVREFLDQNPLSYSQSELLYSRATLVHWSLFVFFKHPRGLDGLTELFFSPLYLNAIQVACPWLISYLATAIVANKRRKNNLKELVKIIKLEKIQDPRALFVQAILSDADFDKALVQFTASIDLVQKDYFSQHLKDQWIENGTLLICETYCRIHAQFETKELAQFIKKDVTQTEQLLQQLVQEQRIDAKVDKHVLSVTIHHQTPQQVVLEKIQPIKQRTQQLIQSIEKSEEELQLSKSD
ncbi:hypothetical protein EDD86DRAFT_191222 [Gorgonomyces haynaldii]|nr:hypothetical protein EDD86DRAFT_191222 [Gorgonomyces haynaldii]